MARGTTLVFKNHQQEPPNIEKENTNRFFNYCFLSLIPSILFCFVSSIMGVDLYTSFQKYHCFWLENWGSTYTRIDLYTRKYGMSSSYIDWHKFAHFYQWVLIIHICVMYIKLCSIPVIDPCYMYSSCN